MSSRRLALAAVVLVLAALAVWLLSASPKAPALTGTTLSGQPVSTRTYEGRPYLVNFWATSCVTCVKEMPELVNLHREFADRGFEVFAIAMAYDVPEYLQRFVEERALPFQVVHDRSGQWAQAYGDIRVTPTTFLVGPQGEILKRYVGPPDFPYLKRWLEQALPARPHDKTSAPGRPPQHGQTPFVGPAAPAS
jgi:peroxiredoxin